MEISEQLLQDKIDYAIGRTKADIAEELIEEIEKYKVKMQGGNPLSTEGQTTCKDIQALIKSKI